MSSGAAERRACVLIVDDQPVNIRVLEEVLKDRYTLCFATSGPRAVERAAAGDVALVLLDVMMPGMDGFEVCRRLKADPRTASIPVIFVTALGDVDDEEKGFDAGGVDYITKPVSPPLVRARVRTHIELKEARDLLERQASLDGLTGIANRRRLDAGLESEWRRAQRGSHWLSLALVDVDHFKAFNDRYGHARGDACLRAVAQALAACCRRPAELAARYGGEEFALVLPEVDPEGARRFAANLLAGVDALQLEHAGARSGRLSVSVGCVSLVPAATRSVAGALEAADRLLYAVKAAGRGHALHEDLETGETARVPSARERSQP